VLHEVGGHLVEAVVGGHHLVVLAQQLREQRFLVGVEPGGLDHLSHPIVQVEVRDAQLLAAVFVHQLHGRAVLLRALEIVLRDVGAEDALRELVALEERRPREADEGRVGQREPHVAREPARLRAVRLVGDHDDVVATAVRLVEVDALVELVDQAEDVARALFEDPLEVLARGRPGRLVVGHAAPNEGLVDLRVEVLAVGHHHEGEVAGLRAAHLLGEEHHRVRLAAPLRVPEHAELAERGMGPLHDLDRRGHLGLAVGSDLLGHLRRLDGRDPVRQPLARWQPTLDRLLVRDRRHRPVDPEDLLVAREHLAHRPGLARVEEDEVLHDVEQAILREHAVEQHLGLDAALLVLVVALPLGEVLPRAREGAVAGPVPVAHHQERVVVKRVGDHLLVHVVPEVAAEARGRAPVEARAEVLVHGLELDEHEREPVDEAQQIGAAVVVRRAHSLDLKLTHGDEAVVRRRAKVDHPRVSRA